MEIMKDELVVRADATQDQEGLALVVLKDLDLALVGGGCGDVAF